MSISAEHGATAFTVTIGNDWVTGYYIFKLTNAAGFQSYVPLRS